MASYTNLGASGSHSSPGLEKPYPLSVVIPTHNNSRELEQCLSAILNNDLSNVEIIVVDDDSSDATSEVMDSFLAVEKALRYVRLENQEGPAGARNEGVKRSRNPYILFVDADVVLQTQALEWIRESLEVYSHRSDVAGVLGSYADTVPWDDFLTNFKNLYVCFIYQITETLSPYLHTPIFCVKKEILVKAGGFDSLTATTEDFRLGIQLGSQGQHFVIDRRVKGRHLKRYTLRSVAREDWRRISDLSTIKFSLEQCWFVFKAHRIHRVLTILLPGLVMLSLVLAITESVSWVLSALLLGIFLVVNMGFLVFCARQKGMVFAIKSCAFLFLEMLWAELALVVAFLPRPKIRGIV